MGDLRPPQPAGRITGPLLTTAALLIVCVGLAATLVWARGLGEPVHIDGWAITFQPPKGWEARSPRQDSYGTTVVYREPDGQGAGREVLISRSRNPDHLSAMRICEALLNRRLGLRARIFFRHPIAFEPWPLGHLPGARCVIAEPQGFYLHVATLTPHGGEPEAYVLELRSERPFEPQDLSLCEALARSVRPAD